MPTILAFAEQRDGELRKASYEVVSEAARLGKTMGKDVAAALIGPGSTALGARLGAYGASKVHVIDQESLAAYSAETYAAAACAIIDAVKPDAVLFAASSQGKDLAPRVAARIGAGLASDVTATAVVDGKLQVVRPVYAGKAFATVSFNSAIAMATLRPNVFAAQKPDASRPCEVTNVAATLPTPRAIVKEMVKEGVTTVELTEAEIVVSGGRGLQGPENFVLIEKLASVLGAAPGASRAIVDAGWIDHHHQVGQTGKTVSPNLYIAIGISGAIQHLAGMSSSKVIVAVNKDPDAPIFKVCTYGIVGDLFQVVPVLTEELRKLRA